MTFSVLLCFLCFPWSTSNIVVIMYYHFFIVQGNSISPFICCSSCILTHYICLVFLSYHLLSCSFLIYCRMSLFETGTISVYFCRQWIHNSIWRWPVHSGMLLEWLSYWHKVVTISIGNSQSYLFFLDDLSYYFVSLSVTSADVISSL